MTAHTCLNGGAMGFREPSCVGCREEHPMSKQVTPETLAAALRYSPMHWEVRRPDGAFVMTRMFDSAEDAAAAIYAALPDQPDALREARPIRFDLDDVFWQEWYRNWYLYGTVYAINNPEPRVVPFGTLTIHEGPCLATSAAAGEGDSHYELINALTGLVDRAHPHAGPVDQCPSCRVEYQRGQKARARAPQP